MPLDLGNFHAVSGVIRRIVMYHRFKARIAFGAGCVHAYSGHVWG
nr:MAG TPA: hypothetical protein [Caudoviricetes sp.]